MPIAVLDFEFDQLPPAVTDLQRYDRAHVLLRVGSRPVCRFFISVRNGRIEGPELRQAALDAGGWALWERWLHCYLDWDESGAPADYAAPSATVATCTRDRPEDLRRCLQSLVILPKQPAEILVIDNCPSTDATWRVVQDFGGSVRYVREDRPGLNIARNRALKEAQGDVVAFIDDDAVADRLWLHSLVKNFFHPLVFCVTGLTLPLELETEAQEWFERHTPFQKGFKRRVFKGEDHDPLAVGRIGAGVNMCLRRTLETEVGLFDESLDSGTPTRSGGDHEMFTRILARGFHIVYEPAALNLHRHRRTWEELRKTLYGYGVGAYSNLMRSLVVERELTAFRIAWSWFRDEQFPMLCRSVLRRRDSRPLDLMLAELRGCLAGPLAYLSSRRRLSDTIAKS